MKKLIMTFLVAGLVITSALSLSSCQKTGTDANSEEWIPTTYDFIDNEMLKEMGLREEGWIICTYCLDTIWECHHDPVEIDHCKECPYGDSHIHWFEPTDNCTSTNQVGTCKYKFKRRHRHVQTYVPEFGYFWHSFHGGGLGGGHD